MKKPKRTILSSKTKDGFNIQQVRTDFDADQGPAHKVEWEVNVDANHLTEIRKFGSESLAEDWIEAQKKASAKR